MGVGRVDVQVACGCWVATVVACAGPAAVERPERPAEVIAARAAPVSAEIAPRRSALPAPAEPAESFQGILGSTAADDGRARERRLRNAFAESGQSAAAAVDLAAHLTAEERFAEALHVLDLACSRAPDASLRLARAGVLRDLARNDLALVDLEEYVARRGRDAVTPGTLFELAQVAWLAGDEAAAAQALRDLRTRHATAPWLEDHREDVREWSVRISRETPATDAGELRDVFALLRCAPRGSDRLRLLERLAASGADARAPVRLRAIGVACADESPAVRARAVQLADANGVADRAFWLTALEDPAALVRRFAARGVQQHVTNGAAPALLAAIEREQTPEPFRAMHAALERALGVEVPLEDPASEAERARVRAAWRERCGES